MSAFLWAVLVLNQMENFDGENTDKIQMWRQLSKSGGNYNCETWGFQCNPDPLIPILLHPVKLIFMRAQISPIYLGIHTYRILKVHNNYLYLAKPIYVATAVYCSLFSYAIYVHVYNLPLLTVTDHHDSYYSMEDSTTQ